MKDPDLALGYHGHLGDLGGERQKLYPTRPNIVFVIIHILHVVLLSAIYFPLSSTNIFLIISSSSPHFSSHLLPPPDSYITN